MEKNRFGRKLVRVYYQISPGIASVISISELRRELVRFFLNPLVKLFKRLGY